MGEPGFSSGAQTNASFRNSSSGEFANGKSHRSGNGQFVSPRPSGIALANPTPGSAMFVAKQAVHGFDPKGWMGKPWQMIPKGGARGIELLNGANLTLVMTGDSDVARFNETSAANSKTREIWISGLKKGEANLIAQNPTTERPVAKLRIQVLPETTLKIGFYLLKHDKGAKGTKRKISDVKATLLPNADKIIRLQSNCRLIQNECKFVTSPVDLEAPPDPYITADELKTEMRRHKPEYNKSDDVRVMLVPHLELNQFNDGHGFYVGGSYEFIAVEDVNLHKKAGQVLAHEIGHHLIAHDHEDHKSEPMNLMIPGPQQIFGQTIRLRRDQILKIHHATD